MKKPIFVTVLAVIVGVGIYFGANANRPSEKSSDLILANVEALSTNDKMCSFNRVDINEDKHKINCTGTGHQCCILR